MTKRMTTTTFLTLATMLSDPGREWYGLELCRATEIKAGSMYPILARCEDRGWLSSRWEDADSEYEGRPLRRLYRMTNAGTAATQAAIEEIVDVVSLVKVP